ncbi:ABC transporter substrate-binding protein [Aphanizomenon flos-aquae]|uniref:ABC transporter substrate-binding protein n=1 Tax=Aphanizomenon flos-aquae TaxID=1176 RepID=UPI00068DFB84|nr:ABC transporter substrate-binding protein [Aphanizomenon flos-aquae]
MAWFWDGLTPKQQVIFAAAAEAQDIAIQENKALQNPQMLLKNYGIDSANYLTEAHAELDKYGFLDYTGCKVKIELVRLWLVETHRLKDEISTLEKVDEEAVNTLLSAADGLRQRNDPLALQIYEKALKINPNNFTTVMSLAKEYLNSGQLNEVGDLCKRAYQFYSINNKQESVDEEDVKNLLSAADELRERNDPLALQIYEKALKINPNNFTTVMSLAEEYSKSGQLNQAYEFYKRAYQLLEEIKVPKSKTNLNVEDTNTNYVPAHKPSPTIPKWLNRSSILRASLGLAGIVVIGAGISQVFRTCPTGERKELGVFCVVDNSRISRGDRTFSPETTNIPRDKGIQALKKGDYPQAANLFKQAIKAKQNDPEVLIYYNNALARQQGSPFTLAVVVPLDKDQDDRNDAQEILRGVAQAQNQFNSNKGLNGRLLEIVIANDSNTEKAKEVAQSLIKDSSILGVIGHNSSDDTKAALPEYAKAKLAVISPTSTSILLNNPVFFRAVYSDESAGKTLAEYTYKSLKLKKAVVFGNPNSPYSNSIREVFTNQFEKLGSEVVHKPLIDLTAPTFDAEKEVAKSVYSNKAEAALLFPDTRSTKIALKIAIETTKRNETLKTKNPPRPELKNVSWRYSL